MFDPDAHLPKPNRVLIYYGACIVAGVRMAREKQVNVRVLPTSQAIDESIELAREILDRVFRKLPDRMKQDMELNESLRLDGEQTFCEEENAFAMDILQRSRQIIVTVVVLYSAQQLAE